VGWPRSVAALGWMLGVMAVTLPFALISAAAARVSMARCWAAGTLRIAGIRLVRSPATLAWPDSPVILVSNHTSLLDIPILCAAFGRPPRFVAKLELGRMPLLAYYMRRTGAVLVDRERAREAVRMLQGVAAAVGDGGNPFCFFAEGSRSPDGFVHRFRNGAFQAAITAGVPVVPVAIVGSERALPRGRLLPRATEVRVSVGEAMAAVDGDTAASFAGRARERLGDLHVQAGGAGLAPET
jgi:1-acyl-sn-glycerol-3-phosphate acyltransferase